MKLYEIPRESKIKANCSNAKGKLIGDTITFHHTDGIYSYCTIDGVKPPNNVCHLSVMQELKLVGDFYELVDN